MENKGWKICMYIYICIYILYIYTYASSSRKVTARLSHSWNGNSQCQGIFLLMSKPATIVQNKVLISFVFDMKQLLFKNELFINFVHCQIYS